MRDGEGEEVSADIGCWKSYHLILVADNLFPSVTNGCSFDLQSRMVVSGPPQDQLKMLPTQQLFLCLYHHQQ